MLINVNNADFFVWDTQTVFQLSKCYVQKLCALGYQLILKTGDHIQYFLAKDVKKVNVSFKIGGVLHRIWRSESTLW